MDFYESLARFEREYFRRALLKFGGRLNRTARKTGVNKTTLIRRLRQLGIHPALEDEASPPASGGIAAPAPQISV